MASTVHGTAKGLVVGAVFPLLALGAGCSADPQAASSSAGTTTAGSATTSVGGGSPMGAVAASTSGGTVTGSASTGGVGTTGAAAGGAASTSAGTTTAAGGGTTMGGVTSSAGGAGGSTATSTTGAGGSGGGAGDQPLDDLPETSCTIDVLSSELAQIETVGIVTFSTDLAGVSSAQIQFGKDTSYGLVAPVDLGAADNRTLLLGMTQDSTYNYRIAVSDGSQVCYSENQTLQTGTLAVSDLAQVNAGAGAPSGFIVASRGSDVIIFNEAGELVWGYTFGGGVFSAHMSWDGQYMFGRDTGPFDAGSGGTFRRVGMDGSGATTMDAPGGDHHDFAPIPGGIAYLGKTAAGECDQVFIASDAITDGAPLFDTWDVFQYFESQGGGGMGELCHANRIHYFAEGDIFTVSDREKDAIAVFQRDGTPITSIGTTPSGAWTQHIQADGAGTTWRVQHGHHYYADGKLLVFSNNSAGGSAMLHYTITGNTAALDWSYSAAGTSMTQGDVQHLPDGSFLVTASNAGTIHLIDSSQNLISTYSAGGGGGGIGQGMGGFGYAWFRTSLYGPPPGRT